MIRRCLVTLRSFVFRAAILLLIWQALSGGGTEYLGYGVLSSVLGALCSLALLPPRRGTAVTLLRRLPYGASLVAWFLWESLRGGADVARRSLRRPVDVEPVVVRAPLTLPPGAARQLALLMINLMPGTMVQRVVESPDGDDAAMVELHALAEEFDPARSWAALEERVALALSPGASSDPPTD